MCGSAQVNVSTQQIFSHKRIMVLLCYMRNLSGELPHGADMTNFSIVLFLGRYPSQIQFHLQCEN